MKKVLLGLLALSAISITGKITSDVPVVKYVVYASPDGTADKSDTLALNDFILSQTASKAGFGKTNPKIYVKRVTGASGAEAYINLESGDDVKFKIQGDAFYTALNSKAWIGNGQSAILSPTALLSKSTLEEIITATKIGFTVNEHGDIMKDVKKYRPMKVVNLQSQANGEFELTSPDATYFGDQITVAEITAIETAFTGGKAISNAKILVKVD